MITRLPTGLRWRTYTCLFAVFVASILLMIFYDGIFQEFASIPAAGALCAALLQIFRDEASHEKALLQMTAQNSFSLGATSHMANVAFDKHSEFCEAYTKELYTALNTLIRDLVSQDALEHARNLVEIRREYAVWLNVGLENKLERFERAIREIGAGGTTENSSGTVRNPEKHQDLVCKVLSIIGEEEYRGVPLDNDLAVTTIIQKLREVLGTEELAKVRGRLVKKALDTVED